MPEEETKRTEGCQDGAWANSKKRVFLGRRYSCMITFQIEGSLNARSKNSSSALVIKSEVLGG